jgi:hypothetical protein
MANDEIGGFWFVISGFGIPSSFAKHSFPFHGET